MTENPKLDRLKELLSEVDDLRKAATLLFWDQRVMMPPGGSEARAEASATIGRLAHERFIAKELGSLLDELNDDDYDYGHYDYSCGRPSAPPEHLTTLRRPLRASSCCGCDARPGYMTFST